MPEERGPDLNLEQEIEMAPGGKAQSPDYVAVRERGPAGAQTAFYEEARKAGVMNAMLNTPLREYERLNPGMRGRWEYAPPGKDPVMVVAREGMGFHVVDASELRSQTPTSQTKGPVRVGDMILMGGPLELVRAMEEADAFAAQAELTAPEEGYRQSLREGASTIGPTGDTVEAIPVGRIKRTQQQVGMPRQYLQESGGGES